MKKIIFFSFFILIVCGLSAQESRLVVWSHTVEFINVLDNYYKHTYPNVHISYRHLQIELFENRLDTAFASGRDVPDVFTIETAFIRKYVESGMLLDLTDLYNADRSRLLSYPAETATYNGRVYAMAWQAAPGAMFYRRSLARKYLGTDDPDRVQSFFSDFNALMETAREIRDLSNRTCVIVSSIDDLLYPFLGARTQPWVINNRLVIDPVMEQYMDAMKELTDQNMEARVSQWSEEWFAGIRGEFRNNKNQHIDVFAYFLPPWGLQYVLKTNAFETSGDWAMIPGPSLWHWGGTWIGAWRDTPKANAAREMIRFFSTDDNFLELYAGSTGEIVNSITAMNRIKNNFSEPFLAGQNHYAMFANIAEGINGRLTQNTDIIIQALFRDIVKSYTEGKITKEKSLLEFRDMVASHLGIN